MKACNSSHSMSAVQQMVRPRLALRRHPSRQSFAAAHTGEISPESEDRFLKVENRPAQIASGNADLVTSARKSRSIIYRANLAAFQMLTSFMVEDCCGGRAELCVPVAGCKPARAKRAKVTA